jgi:hypothetical protein
VVYGGCRGGECVRLVVDGCGRGLVPAGFTVIVVGIVINACSY